MKPTEFFVRGVIRHQKIGIKKVNGFVWKHGGRLLGSTLYIYKEGFHLWWTFDVETGLWIAITEKYPACKAEKEFMDKYIEDFLQIHKEFRRHCADVMKKEYDEHADIKKAVFGASNYEEHKN